MAEALASRWYRAFFEGLERDREVSEELRAASVAGANKRWTAALTGVVAASFSRMGYRAAAKGHLAAWLSVPNEEYLGMDVMAFPEVGAEPWPFPLAVCELENDKTDERVAYSLWKVLCVRAPLRVVFCYRPRPAQALELVGSVGQAVVNPLQPDERTALKGENLLVVGNRGESETFPYGFFRAWKLNMNTGRFEAFSR